MTSRERVFNAYKFKPVDYIPVFANDAASGPRLIGRDFDEDILNDPEALAKAELAVWEVVRADCFNIRTAYAVQKSLGCKLYFPHDDHHQFGEAAIFTKEQAEAIKIPDPETEPHLKVVLDQIRLMRKEAGDEVVYHVTSHGVFNTVSRLLGVEKMMNVLATDRDFFDVIGNKVTDTIIWMAQAVKRAGGDIFELADGMCSPSVLSPKMFTDIVIPHQGRLLRGIHDAGLIAQFHPCGGEYPIIDQMKDTGADSFWFSELVDIAVAQKIFYRRFPVAGGVDPANTLFLGTPETVDRDIKAMIERLKHKSGVIIQPGCGLAPNIPVENLKAMVDAVRKYSHLAGRKKDENIA
ncbi:Uroporphyrinogen decarboxylase (URO-D) [Syntrophobotulus glycolicus DSM 8271]|uniref:Uroporphyrinogen decarboxylase (URO-D) n=1 Tax=Syntrophobotulus glycolicus (strain DSM 8271 / FlGlyR) TaxID=645991 RepID=F0SW38_SYNGF|nr:uroporphyrinogen decarboxylase family protein [Syntrophobotulus glycolicus]ADY56822.1 Uroporphyrinogen decarboxylase (URO-D) [Syntrophobotulus glycolicus DSM 8271]